MEKGLEHGVGIRSTEEAVLPRVILVGHSFVEVQASHMLWSVAQKRFQKAIFVRGYNGFDGKKPFDVFVKRKLKSAYVPRPMESPSKRIVPKLQTCRGPRETPQNIKKNMARAL
ncbi:hypothetical protein IFM89_002057 [Coptis chinensis]|uniref:Uncharacterized protein n=1 Tax=Coptis chinensis TaxID=261450 RepID=A0A835LUE5_9MAGN|nr:hypothetical protein IFM89_002057 [Coptis chinensis]